MQNVPVISLQTGTQVGLAMTPLINPNNLKIEGWFCQVPATKEPQFLSNEDIREVSHYGFAVNSREVVAPLEDFIRLEKTMRLNFQLNGKVVVTESRRKLGKVEDYSVDVDSFYIQKLYVNRRTMGSFFKDQLVVSRMQIREITDKRIVIQDIEAFEKAVFKHPLQVPEG